MLRFRVITPALELAGGEDHPPIVVGRHRSCDIVLHDRAVSGRHCLLEVRRGELWLRDLDSRHGTWADGRRIRQARLSRSTRLQVGATTIAIEVESTGSAERRSTGDAPRRWRRHRDILRAGALVFGLMASLSREPEPEQRTPSQIAMRAAPAPNDAPEPSSPATARQAALSHRVIPFETLGEVAIRYGVRKRDLVRWNDLGDNAAIAEGDILRIESPRRRPLPQQRFIYEVEEGETWTMLAERFGVPVQKLRAYNDNVEHIAAGDLLQVWIDPQPYVAKGPRNALPVFHIDERAVSVGAPNDGYLVDAIQVPSSNAYIRRAPFNTWGSAYAVANLQQAIASFRRDTDYGGTLVLGDMSRQHGGEFPPHLSHQSGRDIDIWLPTFRGVFKARYLDTEGNTPRKPEPEEVDWYATWALVRALIETGAVQSIYLQWDLQERVHAAAVAMGATQEELASIQWPDPASSPRGILRNSDGHTRHIHVRFRCGPNERGCIERAAVSHRED